LTNIVRLLVPTPLRGACQQPLVARGGQPGGFAPCRQAPVPKRWPGAQGGFAAET